MIDEYNFPIRYAVQELKIKGGWAVGYEQITAGFIVSKCYVVESTIQYFSDGKYKFTHKVAFPYSQFDDFMRSFYSDKEYHERSVDIKYDGYGNPYPVWTVSQLFEQYQEAHELAVSKNDDLESNLQLEIYFHNPNWQKDYEKAKEEFDKTLHICQKYESFIANNTKDMPVSGALLVDNTFPLHVKTNENPFVKTIKPVK